MRKICESELKVLTVLWENGRMKAADIARQLKEDVGWSKNTTYTVIDRCVKKQLISRMDPGYICAPAFSKRRAAENSMRELLENYFDGSAVRFFLTFLNISGATRAEAKEMRRILKNRMERE